MVSVLVGLGHQYWSRRTDMACEYGRNGLTLERELGLTHSLTMVAISLGK